MKQETGLATTGSAKFGKLLVEEAVEANRAAMQSKVVGRVQQVLRQLEEQRAFLIKANETIALLEGQIVALEAGKFALNKHGGIEFVNRELNGQVTSIEDCHQCGYPKLVIAPQ